MDCEENKKEYVCEFCNNKFTAKHSLTLHKKTAKFCLEIQKENNTINENIQTIETSEENNYKCEFCNKDFGNKRYLNQHITLCKQKKQKVNTELQKELENIKKILQETQEKLEEANKELVELRIYNKFKNEQIEKLEKEYNKPTTNIYNNKFIQNNKLQVQYNQICEKLVALTQQNIKDEINKMPVTFAYQYDDKNVETSFYKNLTNIFKNFGVCTDKKNKMVIYKDNNGKVSLIEMNTFINIGITLGIQDIQRILDIVEKYYDKKLHNFNITTEEYEKIIDSLTRIRDFLTNSTIDINEHENNLLKDLPGMMISNMEYYNLK
jgi:ribosomal protein L37AE/L43A